MVVMPKARQREHGSIFPSTTVKPLSMTAVCLKTIATFPITTA